MTNLSNDKFQDALDVHNNFWAFHRDRLTLAEVEVADFDAKPGESMTLALVKNCDFNQVAMPAIMHAASFFRSEFKACYFRETDARAAQFTRCVFSECSFRAARFRQAIFDNCKFYRCSFDTASLSHTIFINCTFELCTMREVNDFHTDYRTCTFIKTKTTLECHITLQAILKCLNVSDEYYGGWHILLTVLPMILEDRGGAALYDICNKTTSPILSVTRHYLIANDVMSSHILPLERMLAVATGKALLDCPDYLKEYVKEYDRKEEQGR